MAESVTFNEVDEVLPNSTDAVNKFINYYNTAPTVSKDGKPLKPSKDYAIKLFTKFCSAGVVIDGINAIFSGNMVQITFHGYKNAIYKAYPESVIDIQVIRKGDTYSFAKESGSVAYSHTIADPFTPVEPNIIGAYCIIKNRRGEFLETLNEADYTKMKESSKTPSTWNKWPSEFWKKSVIKRACKTHFYDIVQEIDEEDNKNYKLDNTKSDDDIKASEAKLNAIVEANKAKKPTEDTKQLSKDVELIEAKHNIMLDMARLNIKDGFVVPFINSILGKKTVDNFEDVDAINFALQERAEQQLEEEQNVSNI